MHHPCPLDVLIIGGGAAGLWLLDELRRDGYAALLVERTALGTGQTIASQGILHSGMKHALAGRVGGFVTALRDAGNQWHDCLVGEREPNLQDLMLRGARTFCWRAGTVAGFMGHVGARFALQSGLAYIQKEYRPEPLRHCPGDVFFLEEPIIDPASLLTLLAERNKSSIVHATDMRVSSASSGSVTTIRIGTPDGTSGMLLQPRTIVLTAGLGNEALRGACQLPIPAMRRMPLSILTVRGALPTLNGFCIDGTRAKVVVTTQRVSAREAVWQVASECVTENAPPGTFMAEAWRHLNEALPEFPWPQTTLDTHTAVRAEGASPDDLRSNDVAIRSEGNVLTAWPTKLVLVPRLAERVRALLPSPACHTDIRSLFQDWPRPPVASYPWDAQIDAPSP